MPTMPTWRAALCASTLLASSLLLGCASSRTCPATPPSMKGAAQASAPAESGALEPQASLLEHVPSTARVAFVVRASALKLLSDWLNSSPQMKTELAAQLGRTVGADLTNLAGAVLFLSELKPKPRGALVLRVPGTTVGPLLGWPQAGVHLGVPYGVITAAAEGQLYGARLRDAVIFGSEKALQHAIALGQGQARALGPQDPLGALLRADNAAVEVLGGASLEGVPELAAQVQRFGIKAVTLTFDRRQQVTLRASGDAAQLELARQLLRTAISMGLLALQQKKEQSKAGPGFAETLSAIVGFYQAQSLFAALEPQREGNELVSRYTLPAALRGPGFVATLGMLSAIAIPAFVTYIRKAKTVEATATLERIKQGLLAEHAQRKQPLGRLRLAASTPWSPPTPCCQSPSKPKCTPSPADFAHPSWKRLGLSFSEPHSYQYRLSSAGVGRKAKVTIEARGDLNCDGKSSSFRLEGVLNAQGELTFGAPSIENETE